MLLFLTNNNTIHDVAAISTPRQNSEILLGNQGHLLVCVVANLLSHMLLRDGEIKLVVFILAVMVAFLDKMLDVISALPGAGFQIDIENASGVCVLYAVVIMLCLFFRNRKIRYLVYALSLCAVSDILGLI